MSETKRDRERQRVRQRERQRETDRQRQSNTERQTDRDKEITLLCKVCCRALRVHYCKTLGDLL